MNATPSSDHHHPERIALSAPVERDMPGDRRHALLEFLMSEITPSTPARTRGPLRWVAGAAAAATAAVAAALALPGAAAAWEVDDGPGGVVEVRIHEFRDPEGLERRLREEGVPANIDYLESDRYCQYADPAEGQTTPGEVFVEGGESEQTWFALRRGVLKPGELVSVTIYTSNGEPSHVSTGVVRGPDPRCEFVGWTFEEGPPSPEGPR